jgi:hypothetical protein
MVLTEETTSTYKTHSSMLRQAVDLDQVISSSSESSSSSEEEDSQSLRTSSRNNKMVYSPRGGSILQQSEMRLDTDL